MAAVLEGLPPVCGVFLHELTRFSQTTKKEETIPCISGRAETRAVSITEACSPRKRPKPYASCGMYPHTSAQSSLPISSKGEEGGREKLSD